MLAAESAVREIVGKNDMDSCSTSSATRSHELMNSIQSQLDRLKAGILIVNVNVQSVQAPEQVQAAFDDAFQGRPDRESRRTKARPMPTT